MLQGRIAFDAVERRSARGKRLLDNDAGHTGQTPRHKRRKFSARHGAAGNKADPRAREAMFINFAPLLVSTVK